MEEGVSRLFDLTWIMCIFLFLAFLALLCSLFEVLQLLLALQLFHPLASHFHSRIYYFKQRAFVIPTVFTNPVAGQWHNKIHNRV